LWLFEKTSESENRQFQLFQKHKRITCSFHENTRKELPVRKAISRIFQKKIENQGFIFTLLNDLQMVKLKAFDKFVNTAHALSAVSHIVDGKLPKGLNSF
jgi:hypothetical protein